MMNLFWDWYDSSEDEGGTLTVVILLGGLFLFVLNFSCVKELKIMFCNLKYID